MRRAIICFLQRSRSILLIRAQYPDKTVWNGVSGYIEEGEMSAQAAVREVREEIGVEITPADLDFLGVHELFDIYRVEKWEGEPESKEKSILELKWFDIAELPYDQMHAGNSDWLPNFFKQS